MITLDQIEEYKKYGVLVIEDVLTEEEINTARQGFHDQLLEFGIDNFKQCIDCSKLPRKF